MRWCIRPVVAQRSSICCFPGDQDLAIGILSVLSLPAGKAAVPRCLEEVSVPGLVLFSFQAVVRSTNDYARSVFSGVVLLRVCALSRGLTLSLGFSASCQVLPRAFVVSCGILAGCLSLACMQVHGVGRSGRHRARASAAHFASRGSSVLCFVLTAMKKVHSETHSVLIERYTRDPAERERFPRVREKTTSAVQSVSQENNFVKSVVAFAAVERILSSAVPSASFTGRRIVVSFRNSLSPKFPLRAANVLPWVHWLRVVPWIAVFAALSRIFLASGFAWISVSDGYLAQFLHAELSSNCMMEPGFTGRRRSSSLTVLTTLLNREHHCGCRQLFENHTDPFQQGWASARLLSGTTSCSSSFPAVACGRWSLLLVSREARSGQFSDDFFR